MKFPRPYPKYCCQDCGECLGWLGKLSERFFGKLHDCIPNETNHVIEDDDV
jgi:hypothetical protein